MIDVNSLTPLPAGRQREGLMNIRTTIAQAIKKARAESKTTYVFDGDDYENGSRDGYRSGVLDTLIMLAKATKPQQHVEHVKCFRSYQRVYRLINQR